MDEAEELRNQLKSITQAKLGKLLGKLINLVSEHGPKSEPVREFVRAQRRKKVQEPEFESLAWTVLLLAGWKSADPTSPGKVKGASREERPGEVQAPQADLQDGRAQAHGPDRPGDPA